MLLPEEPPAGQQLCFREFGIPEWLLSACFDTGVLNTLI